MSCPYQNQRIVSTKTAPSLSSYAQRPQGFHNNNDNNNNNNHNKCKIIGGYRVEHRLGAGSFATVYKGVKQITATGVEAGAATEAATTNNHENDPNTNEVDVVAIKAISRKGKKCTPKIIENLDLEIALLKTYRHPNIVALHQVQKTDRHFYLFLEFCGGGDVQQLIRTRRKKRLSEGLTRRLIRDLTSGLTFLWGQHVIHRDIKPQNLLLTGLLPLDEIEDECLVPAEEQKRRDIDFPSEKFALKIADFGFARPLERASLAETLCGSPLYMAPEILEGQKYDAKADLWSVGTVLFEMIAGRPPFMGDNHIHLLRNIQTKSLRMPEGVKVSSECVNLLRLLLNRKPKKRAGFQEFFQASNVFVSLGCRGPAPNAQAGHNCHNAQDGQATKWEDNIPFQRPDFNRMDTVAESTSSHESIDDSPTHTHTHTHTNRHTSSSLETDTDFDIDIHTDTHPRQTNESNPKGISRPNPPARILDDNQISATPPTPAAPIRLFHPSVSPSHSKPFPLQNAPQQHQQQHQQQQLYYPPKITHNNNQHQFIPLAPSPPGPKSLTGQTHLPDKIFQLPPLPFSSQPAAVAAAPATPNNPFATNRNHSIHHPPKQPRHYQQQQQYKTESSMNSESDHEFVMVEHGTTSTYSSHISQNNANTNASNTQRLSSTNNTQTNQHQNQQQGGPIFTQPFSHPHQGFIPKPISNGWTTPPTPTSSSSKTPLDPNKPIVTTTTTTTTTALKRSIRSVTQYNPRVGILSTSPDSAGALIAMIISPPPSSSSSSQPNSHHIIRDQSSFKNFHRLTTIQNAELKSKTDISIAATMLATAEDIGRRAVNVAQIGDSRSLMAMRLSMMQHSHSQSPMEDLEDVNDKHMFFQYDQTRTNDHRNTTTSFDAEMSTDDMEHPNKGTLSQKQTFHDEDDQMPFAVASLEKESPCMFIPHKTFSNNVHIVAMSNGSCGNTQMRPPSMKSSTAQSLSHFREALSCYLKALSLMRGAVHAIQLLKEKIGNGIHNYEHGIQGSMTLLSSRCDTSLHWLSGQFRGVLERADACNLEIGKISANTSTTTTTTETNTTLSVEELIYNHSLTCGRDGAVKQLLGHYEHAKVCYRSAGLLLEAILMEQRVGEDDRKILNGYIEGFAERIRELDSLIAAYGTSSASRRGGGSTGTGNTESFTGGGIMKGGSAVVGLIGGVIPPSHSFRSSSYLKVPFATQSPRPVGKS